MSLGKWAEREVELACKRENQGRKEGEWDYGCACYESALKAFKSLLEDGHSGMSIGFTKQILNRMIDNKPLTPIEDTDDVWNKCCWEKDNGVKNYQCRRMSSFFKDVYPNGTIKYSDNDRVIGINIDSPNVEWHMGLVSKIIDEMYPITMPYIPADKPYKVFCEEFLTDPKNGDFDTVGVFYVVKPDGERVEINRFFKEGQKGFIEIDAEEYHERKKKAGSL